MKTMSVGEFKTRFSEVIEWVKSGKKVAVTYGRKKEIVGYFVSEPSAGPTRRKLGLLEGKAKATFTENFKMTEEEFLGQ
ncbi:MAG: hypothetical protein U5K31_04845 [Balneolaceae bacterium]|nr:hypothetical protein [Balneolaceae bacterium]